MKASYARSGLPETVLVPRQYSRPAGALNRADRESQIIAAGGDGLTYRGTQHIPSALVGRRDGR